MKKLASLFLWFCAATVLAQAAILALSYFRGNLDKDSMTKVVATLNGIDIQGERLRKAIQEAKDTPVPSHEEILAARAQMSLDFDSRERALSRTRDQLEAMQTKLQVDLKEFETRRLAFEEARKQQEKNVNEQTLGEVQRILESLPPEQSKTQILKMMEDGRTEDVVAIVKGFTEEKRKKILSEFTQGDEAQKLNDILVKIRNGDDVNDTASNAGID